MDDQYDEVDELPERPRKEIAPADFELLVMAARAINADFEEVDGEGYATLYFPDGSVLNAWNPLVHSDDAFELGVRLKLFFDYPGFAYKLAEELGPPEEGRDQTAATRRAVVRAAAEIIRFRKFLNETT